MKTVNTARNTLLALLALALLVTATPALAKQKREPLEKFRACSRPSTSRAPTRCTKPSTTPPTRASSSCRGPWATT